MTKFDYTKQPRRPFGVSIAIVAGIILFTILPILEVVFLLSIDSMMVFDEVGRSGLDLIGVDGFRQQTIPQIVFALIYLIIAIFAWLGRPPMMRIIFSITILLIGALTVVQQILPRLGATPTTLDSSREINQPVLIFYLVITVLITLYGIWYMNRWASRAFYRGFYLPEDIEAMKALELQFNPPVESTIEH